MGSKGNILIVDDDKGDLLLTSEALKHEGYSVFTAADGFKAIAACRVHTADVILLKMQLPLMNGLDVLKRLRAQERTMHIPVVFMIDPVDKDTPAQDKALADHDCIKKPLDKLELLSRVQTALRLKSLKEELATKDGEIQELALADPLTALASKRFLEEFLKAEIKQSRRYKVPLSLLLLEVDQYNDLLAKWGQGAVDLLLADLAAMLGKINRDSDLLARLNENEFAVLLPHTPEDGASRVAERIRATVAAAPFPIEKESVALTVAIGLCELSDQMDNQGSTLISYAWSAMRQAASQGGNLALASSR